MAGPKLSQDRVNALRKVVDDVFVKYLKEQKNAGEDMQTTAHELLATALTVALEYSAAMQVPIEKLLVLYRHAMDREAELQESGHYNDAQATVDAFYNDGKKANGAAN